MIKNLSAIVLLLVVVLASACNTNPSKQEDYSDFANFYSRFHTDSLFQMAHILFPLDGLPQEADSLTIASGQFKWHKEDWVMHRGFDLEGNGFVQEFSPIGDDFIVEKIIHKEYALTITRHFSKIGDEWHLIYYSGLNRVAMSGNEQ
ncbi:MAG TPA: hypothetical protein PKA00_21405 [Saprospiraceae bacterium]|nr:hypothetical protein [Saprospiraceae bacterium]HMQ85482.1 hypothetical protein [Saprospiraceae bacterium]